MPSRTAAAPRSASAKKAAAAEARTAKGTAAAEDVRLQAKADRTRKYMSDARARERELERGGMFF